MEIVKLRVTPTVVDIPGQLRAMADRIEAGEIEATSILFIIAKENDWPDIYGWGDHLGDHGNIAICELSKAWFINNSYVRAG